MQKLTRIAGLLMIGLFIFSLSACNKEPADIAEMPADYDLKSAINELPTESKTNTETDTSSAKEQEEPVLEAAPIKPSESFACLGVNDQLITNHRAGLFVPGSLPLADLFELSLTSQVEFIKNGLYFDVLFNYYKDGKKLVAQYECPQAIKGNLFIDHINEDEYRKKCRIEEKEGKYVVPQGCKPRFYCQGPNVKLKIFENFVQENSQDNKVIKTFETKDNNSCKNARQLYEAAREGNLEQVKELLPKTDVNIATSLEPNPEKFSQWEPYLVFNLNRPLLVAINEKHIRIIKLLLKNGANPDLTNLEEPYQDFFAVSDDPLNALGWAIKTDNEEIINLILPKIKSKKSSLLVAACYGNNEIVKTILKEDTSTINKDGFILGMAHTPLGCALEPYEGGYTPKHREVVKTLVAYGADVNLPDPSGDAEPFYCTPLRIAVYNNDLEIAKLLIDNGADVNLKIRVIYFSDNEKDKLIMGDCAAAGDLEGLEVSTEMGKLLSAAGADDEVKKKKSEIEIIVNNPSFTYDELVEWIKQARAKE